MSAEWNAAIDAAVQAIESIDITTPALFARGSGNIAELVRQLAAQRVRELHVKNSSEPKA